MSFLDIYMPDEVPGYPCISAPRTKTTIQATAGGGEQRNQDWEHPLHRFVLPEAIARDWSVVEDLKKHWLITRGPFHSFPWRDPLDKASCDLLAPNEPDAAVIARVAATDQPLGTVDGFTDTFRLMKTYLRGGETYDRMIYLPVLDTVVIAIDGDVIPGAGYTVSRPGGEVTFAAPPDPGDYEDGIITAGFLFDVEVRFESDDVLEALVRTWQVGGFADLTLIEVRPC
jgi:uncharacterized protein (TIGR02217 family)